MIIYRPVLIRSPESIRYVVAVGGGIRPGDDSLWFDFPDEYKGFVTDCSDAALTALLIPAMRAGQDIRVEGAVSAQLLQSLNGEVQALLRQVMPFLKQIRIEAAEVKSREHGIPRACATGYSGGGDSLCTLLFPRPAGTPPFSHITHYNVGSHGKGANGRKAYLARLARAKSAADRLNIPLIGCDSNLDEFFDKKTDFISTHSVRNAAATLCLQGGLARYEYSGAYHRSRQGMRMAGDISRLEDMIVPLLSTETLSFGVFGSDLTRVEKILFLSEQPMAWELLDVCMEPRKAGPRQNCSACLKCMRAMIVLDIAGRLDRFATVFDLRKFRRLRWWAYAQLLNGSEDSRSEVEAYAVSRRFAYPPLARLCSGNLSFRFAKLAKKIIERLS